MRAIGISDLMRAMASEAVEATRQPPIETAIQARVLLDLLTQITGPCPFAVGDLVIQIGEAYRWPAKDQVSLVVAVKDVAGFVDNEGVGERRNMAIATLRDNSVIINWVESYRFRKYDGVVA